MTLFHARALWPTRDRTPAGRLWFALVLAPTLVAGTLSLFSFLVAGMTETTAQEVWEVTARSAVGLSVLVFGFMASFGMAGVALLWWRAWRSTMAWALVGAALGCAAGILFGVVAMPAVYPALVSAFGFVGWALFVLARLFAGVRAGVRAGAGPGELSGEPGRDGGRDRGPRHAEARL